MEKVAALAQRALKNFTTGSKTTPSTEPLAPRLTAALFSKLQVRYGHKWTSQFSTPELQRLALEEWSAGLTRITPEQLRDGLNAWNGDWPPSLPEFLKACTGYQEPAGGDLSYCPTYGYNFSPERDKAKLLPAINRTPVLVKEHDENMGRLRKALHG